MARIAGVNIPTNKRVLIALQYIHGIGQKNAGRDHGEGEHPVWNVASASSATRKSCRSAKSSIATIWSRATFAVKSA